jgi:hypothetical protein
VPIRGVAARPTAASRVAADSDGPTSGADDNKAGLRVKSKIQNSVTFSR